MAWFAQREKVTLAERKHVGAIQRKQPEPGVQPGQFVEVESEVEETINEAVFSRRKPVMKHAEFVETR
jgi:hypothetical protein